MDADATVEDEDEEEELTDILLSDLFIPKAPCVVRFRVLQRWQMWRERERTNPSSGSRANVIIGKLIPAGTGLPARREQLDWMPRPKPLSAVFGAEEEELPALPAEEELSLEDLEDEDEEEELTDILDEEGPATVTETKE